MEWSRACWEGLTGEVRCLHGDSKNGEELAQAREERELAGRGRACSEAQGQERV